MKVIRITIKDEEINMVAIDEFATYKVESSIEELIDNLYCKRLEEIKINNDSLYLKFKDTVVAIDNYAKYRKMPIFEKINKRLYEEYRKEKLRLKKVKELKVIATVTTVLAFLSALLIADADAKEMNLENNDNTTSYEDNLLEEISYDDINVLSDEEIEVYYEEENEDVSEVLVEEIEEKEEINEIESLSLEEPVYEEVETNEDQEDILSLNIAYDDRTSDKKIATVYLEYSDIINKYSNMYGLDGVLMMAVAAQERGTHSNEQDLGGGVGLMQIQASVWLGKAVVAYNYETGMYDTVEITEENIGDLDTNIRLGCMIMQKSMEVAHYNLLAGLQTYNMGYSNFEGAILNYAIDTGKDIENILNNPSDIGWITKEDNIYRVNVGAGDPYYIEHVLSFIGNNLNLKLETPSGEISLNINKEEEKELQRQRVDEVD